MQTQATLDTNGTVAGARHRPHDDLQAFLTGTLFVGLGIVMFNQAGLLTGGTAGLALLLHYATGVDFAPAFFLVNLPFYALAWLRMGAAFTLKTFAAVALLSLFAWLLPQGLAFRHLSPPLAAVLGGLVVADPQRVALSVLGAVVLNLTLTINHRPGRYMAV